MLCAERILSERETFRMSKNVTFLSEYKSFNSHNVYLFFHSLIYVLMFINTYSKTNLALKTINLSIIVDLSYFFTIRYIFIK